MPAQWTGEVIGEMHLHDVTGLALANKLCWHPKYLSAVLHGHRAPKNAEQKVKSALAELIMEMESQP